MAKAAHKTVALPCVQNVSQSSDGVSIPVLVMSFTAPLNCGECSSQAKLELVDKGVIYCNNISGRDI